LKRELQQNGDAQELKEIEEMQRRMDMDLEELPDTSQIEKVS